MNGFVPLLPHIDLHLWYSQRPVHFTALVLLRRKVKGLDFTVVHVYVGTAVAQWLWCCASNRKVAGSFPDGVIGICH